MRSADIFNRIMFLLLNVSSIIGSNELLKDEGSLAGAVEIQQQQDKDKFYSP